MKKKKIVSRVRVVALSLCYTADTHIHSGTRTTAGRHTYVDSLVKVALKLAEKINNEKRVGQARAFKNRVGKKKFDRRDVVVFLTR